MALRFQQKLLVPRLTRPLIERPHVREQLDQAIATKNIVALVAPAGWGKTTLLSQWAERATLPIAWYTLDTTDRDPYVFLDYLVHAIADIIPGIAGVKAQLATSSPQALPDLFHTAALEIAAAPEPFVLVLDDFHVFELDSSPDVPGAALVFELLARIAEYAPACHLVVASRTLLSLHGLARLGVQERADVFDYRLLQLSAPEVQQLAGLTSNVLLSDARASQLTVQMGGWVTGIVLSLNQSSRAVSQPAIELSGDPAPIYAYFAEQIIAPLQPALQRFLEDTSVLDNLTPQRCDALRHTTDAGQLLSEVTRRVLFVSQRGSWLTYHSLFREFLRTRLAQDSARECALLRQAGDLYAADDEIELALDCYLSAGAVDSAVDMLRGAGARLRQQSRQTTLLTCFERLHRAFERSIPKRIPPPDLLLAQALVCMELALWEQAQLAIQLAEATGDDAIYWEASIVRAGLMVLQGDAQQARIILDGVPADRLTPRLQLDYHLTAARIQILQSQVPDAITALEQANRLTPLVVDSANIARQRADIADNLGWAYAVQGDRPSALRQLKRADAGWQASGDRGRRVMTLNNLGTLAMEEGRFAEARAAFEDGLELAKETTRQREEMVLRYSLAELAVAEDDLDRALEHFSAARALAERLDIPSSAAGAAVGELWAAALMGDLALAERYARLLDELPAPQLPRVRRRLALARSLLLLRHRSPDATALAGLLSEAESIDAAWLTPERAYLALLQATLALAHGGWVAAAAAWGAFESEAIDLPETLLPRLVTPHAALFEAARERSPLAQRLLSARIPMIEKRWQITVMGGFACLHGGEPCDLSPLHQALLARLLDAGSQGLTVERLWEAVWGDTDLSIRALRQALYRLRGQTGLDITSRDGNCVIRTPWNEIDYDARALERALDEPLSVESIQHVIALYQGDFLPGAPLTAALWADTRRAYLQQRYLTALEGLAREVEHDTPHLAIHYYQQVLQIDGCREQTAVQLMRLAARFGNRSLVSATFEQLVAALRTLGATPDISVSAVFQQLR